MKSIVVQIYEVQNPLEAEALIEIGVDHIGSVVLSEAEWKIPSLKETIQFIKATASRSSLIPLFGTESVIFRALDYYQPDIVHFCEALPDPENEIGFLENLVNLQENVKTGFPGIRIMRSIPIPPPNVKGVKTVTNLARIFEPVSDFFLTDTLLMEAKGSSCSQPVKGFVGITGRTCDWDIAAKLVESSRIPVILAGGISADNVFSGIVKVRPAGVDSCTQTNALDAEGRPIRFRKDIDKVKRLVDEVRRAEVFVGEA